MFLSTIFKLMHNRHCLSVFIFNMTCFILSVSSGYAAQSSISIPVSVTVIANAKIQSSFDTKALVITQQDIERGYIDIPLAYKYVIHSNSRAGYILQFDPVGFLFQSVIVSGLGAPVQIGTDGGSIVQRGSINESVSHELSFRFNLRSDLLAGQYPWPLQISVLGLS